MANPPPNSISGQINYVMRLWEDPCDAPWTVYIETALPAALELYISLATFGALDVVRAAAQPGRGRGGAHGRRGSRSRGRGKSRSGGLGRIAGALTSPGESLGAKIGSEAGIRGRSVSQGVSHMWAIDGVIQRGLWAWMVADLASDFAANWTSNLYNTKFCQAKDDAVVYVEDNGAGALAIQGWVGSVWADPVKQRGPVGYNAGAVLFEDASGFAVVHNTVRNVTDQPTVVDAAWAVGSNPDAIRGTPSSITLPPFGEGTISVSIAIPPNLSVAPIFRAFPGSVTGVDGSILAQGARTA